ncbi:hypothetical protein [Streptomyces sp. NPDC059122]|uniref:hypothetical protein n=1 Tax=Streptomyces sp. NPDC059122 TaxID=3346732 RepID=UPI0036B6F799
MNAVIPEQKDQAANRKKKGSAGGRPVSHDADLYKERNTVKRLINTLNTELTAWQNATNTDQRQVNWQFTTHDARIKLRHLYPKH